MATLTSEDYTQIRQWIKSNGDWATFKTMGHSKQQFYDILQAIETWEVSGHTTQPTESRDAAIDAAAGVNVTTAQAIMYWGAWTSWKVSTL